MLLRRGERPPASGPPTPDSSPEGGNRGREITGHAGREPAKVDSRMTVSRIDILVENHVSIALLHPPTCADRAWLDVR